MGGSDMVVRPVSTHRTDLMSYIFLHSFHNVKECAFVYL